MKVKVVNSLGGVYEYPQRLAEKLVQARRVQFYQTRDMRASSENSEVDSAGDVWDAEAHTESRLKNKDGTWRKRPGASKADKE